VAWTKWSYMDHWVTETPQGPQPPSFNRASMDRDVKQLAALTAYPYATKFTAPHVPETHDRIFADSGKEVRDFAGQPYVLDEAIRCDAALVHAWMGDRHGNLVYRESAQNFNPLCAMAGRLTIAEVEHLDPDDVSAREFHTLGVFLQLVLHVPDTEKRIERHTTRPEPVLAAMQEVQT
jgi:Coenzyme A transferase